MAEKIRMLSRGVALAVCVPMAWLAVTALPAKAEEPAAAAVFAAAKSERLNFRNGKQEEKRRELRKRDEGRRRGGYEKRREAPKWKEWKKHRKDDRRRNDYRRRGDDNRRWEHRRWNRGRRGWN